MSHYYHRTVRDPTINRFIDHRTGEVLPEGQKTNCNDESELAATCKLVWPWVRRIIALFLFFQTFAFVSFMFEESLQTTGFAIKASLDAGDLDAARNARDNYQRILWKAQSWQHSLGRLAFLSNGGYTAYFDIAATQYLAANEAQIRTATPRTMRVWIGKGSSKCEVMSTSAKGHCQIIGRNIVQGWPLTKEGGKPERFAVFGGSVPTNVLGWELRGRAWLNGKDPYEAYPPGSVPGDEFP